MTAFQVFDDTPIAEVLPKFAQMQVQKVYDGPITADNLEPAVRPITIRQCLTHTAGLGYSIVQQGPLGEAMQDRGSSHWTDFIRLQFQCPKLWEMRQQRGKSDASGIPNAAAFER